MWKGRGHSVKVESASVLGQGGLEPPQHSRQEESLGIAGVTEYIWKLMELVEPQASQTCQFWRGSFPPIYTHRPHNTPTMALYPCRLCQCSRKIPISFP